MILSLFKLKSLILLAAFSMIAARTDGVVAQPPPDEEIKKIDDLFGDFDASKEAKEGDNKSKEDKTKKDGAAEKPAPQPAKEAMPDKNGPPADSKVAEKGDQAKVEGNDAKPPAKKLNKAEEALRSKRVTIVIDDMKISDALKELEKQVEVEIILDEESIKGSNVDGDTKVTLEVPKSILLRSALKILLERNGLTWKVEGESIRVVKNENAQVAVAMQAIAPAMQVDDQIESQGNSLLQVELAFLRRACKLTEEDEPKLAIFDKKWMKKSLKTGANRVVNGMPVDSSQSRSVLRLALEKAMSKELESILSDEQRELYRKEKEARAKFDRDATLDVVIVLLNEHLRLREDQKVAIREGLSKSYRDDSDMRNYLQNNYLPQLPDSIVIKHLDAEQKDIYRSIPKYSFGFQEEVIDFVIGN